MIRIVTGKINSQKSTRLLEYYQDHPQGDGFISRKIMQGNLVYGYNLLQLSNNKLIPFVIRDIYDDGSKAIICKVGPYHFYEDAFNYVEEMVDDFIAKKISPVFLDEISLLELNDQGFHQVLVKLIENDMDLCLVVRDDLINQVVHKYQMKEVEII
jgi:nucleoside-triphosphatase THEP1